MRLSGKCESTGPVRVEYCQLSNQTIKCEEFGKAIWKKNSGMRDFLKKRAFVWDQDRLCTVIDVKYLSKKNVSHDCIRVA